MITSLISGLLLLSTSPSLPAHVSVLTQPATQTSGAPTDQAGETTDLSAPVWLEDVEVTGRPLDTMIRSFINEVAAPVHRRGLARWTDRLCVGAANMPTEAAQYLVDRVSTVADDLGLRVGAPGCDPNILIVATSAPQAVSQAMIDLKPRLFRGGGSGMNQGSAALRNFVQSEAPVRWWQVAMPYDAHTGSRAVMLPGDRLVFTSPNSGGDSDLAVRATPNIKVATPSLLTTQIHDKLTSTVVVVDVTQTDGVSMDQLADYIAMVSFAQIDPSADTSGYASILNLFDEPQAATSGLTDWDLAYLNGLYEAERTLQSQRASRGDIAASIRRAHENIRANSGE